MSNVQQSFTMNDTVKIVKKLVRKAAELRTPRAISWFKLGAALVAVVVAADELINSKKK